MNKEELDGFIFELFTEEIFLIDSEDKPSTASSKNTTTVVKETSTSYSTELKPIVLIVSNNDFQSNKEFLEKVFKAVQLTFADISVVESAPISALEKTNKVIFMGTSPFENSIQNKNFNLYEVSDYNNKLVLQTENASVIQKNTDKKRALWVALQRMFPSAKS